MARSQRFEMLADLEGAMRMAAPDVAAHLGEAISAIRRSHHFVFDYDYASSADVPTLDEVQVAEALPLPYPHCVFEFLDGKGGGVAMVAVADQSHAANRIAVFSMASSPESQSKWVMSPKGFMWERSVNGGNIHALYNGLPLKDGFEAGGHGAITQYARTYSILVDVLLTVHAKTSSVSSEEYIPSRDGPKTFSEKRKQRAVVPKFSYHIVDVGLSAEAKRHVDASAGSDRASPRLHWRRAHMRTLPDGRRVPVQRALIGLAERGVVIKEYRVHSVATDDTVH